MKRQKLNSFEKSEAVFIVPKDILENLSEGQERILSILERMEDLSPQGIGDYITEADAKNLLGRKTTWFWGLRKAGKLPFTKIGSKIFYNKSAIIALLDSNRKGYSNV